MYSHLYFAFYSGGYVFHCKICWLMIHKVTTSLLLVVVDCVFVCL
ncbi:hypothetical protein EC2872000_5168 [Escherichia coli 2872000]|nr:hypothetical protein EC2872000_5168 [Escherichia coli 2872000]